jgi:SH3-like domain-containing protein
MSRMWFLRKVRSHSKQTASVVTFSWYGYRLSQLNLRQDFKNLTEVVNQIMAHVDKNLEENRREWEKLISANEKSDT